MCFAKCTRVVKALGTGVTVSQPQHDARLNQSSPLVSANLCTAQDMASQENYYDHYHLQGTVSRATCHDQPHLHLAMTKITKAKRHANAARRPIQPDPESLDRLSKMVWTREQGQQLFSELLLREVRKLRDSERNLQQEVKILKEVIASRRDNERNTSCSDDSGSEQGCASGKVFIGDPMASLLGVDGAEGGDMDSDIEESLCDAENHLTSNSIQQAHRQVTDAA